MHGLCSVVLCFGARIKQMFSLCINTLSHTHTHNFTYITYTNTNIHIHSHTHACTHSDTHRPQWHTPFSSKIKLYRAQNQLTGTSKREKCQTHFLLFCQAFLTMKICDFFFSYLIAFSSNHIPCVLLMGQTFTAPKWQRGIALHAIMLFSWLVYVVLV